MQEQSVVASLETHAPVPNVYSKFMTHLLYKRHSVLDRHFFALFSNIVTLKRNAFSKINVLSCLFPTSWAVFLLDLDSKYFTLLR